MYVSLIQDDIDNNYYRLINGHIMVNFGITITSVNVHRRFISYRIELNRQFLRYHCTFEHMF